MAPIHWVYVNIQQATDDDRSEHDSLGEEADGDACILEDTYEAILGEDGNDEQDGNDPPLALSSYDVTPATPSLPDPRQMIERELWVSAVNPVSATVYLIPLFVSLMDSQYTARIDTSVSLPSILPGLPATPPNSCVIPADNNHPQRLSFPGPALGRFHKPNAWLNDDCIDLGAQLIVWHLGTAAARGDPVVFSTFVLPRHHKGGDEGLWRACKWSSEFWKKDIWIFPVHADRNHWVLVIVYWKKRQIAYFDSLYSETAFKTHVKVRNCLRSLFQAWDVTRSCS